MKKRRAFLRATALTTFLIAPAITPARDATRLALHAGLNVSKFERYASDVDPKLGFSIGPSVVYGITDRLGIQAELLYTQKGGRLTSSWWIKYSIDRKISFYTAPDPVDVSLGYLELPLLARLALPGTEWLRPYVVLGPAAAVQIDGGPTPAFLLSQYRKADINLVFGAGAAFSLGRHYFYVGARHSRGLTEVSEDWGRNVAWALEVGYGL